MPGDPGLPRRSLLHALVTQELMPSDDSYARVWADVSARGGSALAWIRHSAGAALLDQSAAATGHGQGDLVRIAGFGSRLTAAAGAVIDIGAGDLERIARLGGLANLIVTSYDSLVDRSKHAAPLSSETLRRLGLTGVPHAVGRSSPLVDRLVGLYLREAATLPSPQVIEDLYLLIGRMYEAELSLATGGTSLRAWRRKVALPFLVMVLPLWAAGQERWSGQREWQLRWIGRMGLLLGWIDDAVDLPADTAAGDLNRWIDRPTRSMSSRVARLMTALLQEWELREGRDGEAMRATLRSVVLSWFGGPPVLRGCHGDRVGSS